MRYSRRFRSFCARRWSASPTWARLRAGSEEMDLDEDDAPGNAAPSDVDPETGEILRPEDIPF